MSQSPLRRIYPKPPTLIPKSVQSAQLMTEMLLLVCLMHPLSLSAVSWDAGMASVTCSGAWVPGTKVDIRANITVKVQSCAVASGEPPIF
jgi:hypothetical protein